MKTIEEIIENHFTKYDGLRQMISDYRHESILSGIKKCMQKYAEIKCAEQRIICQRLRDAETAGLIDEIIGPVYANCPLPKFD